MKALWTFAHDRFKRLQESLAPLKQNKLKWGVAENSALYCKERFHLRVWKWVFLLHSLFQPFIYSNTISLQIYHAPQCPLAPALLSNQRSQSSWEIQHHLMTWADRCLTDCQTLRRATWVKNKHSSECVDMLLHMYPSSPCGRSVYVSVF